MNVLIEFFDKEQIENVNACLNYKFDKVYFYGHAKKMGKSKKKAVTSVLMEKCGMENKNIFYKDVSVTNFDKIVDTIAEDIQKEIDAGNACFFDLTGGQDIILAAMGALSERYSLPMFQTDIRTGNEITVNMGGKSLADFVEKDAKKLNVEEYIKLLGGVINYDKQESHIMKHPDMEGMRKDVKCMYDLAMINPSKWNGFTSVFRGLSKYFCGTTTLIVYDEDLDGMFKKPGNMSSEREFNSYVQHLLDDGIITEFSDEIEEGTSKLKKTIKFKNYEIVECITKSGDFLELETYYERKESGKYDDVRVSIYIDWDGVIQESGPDVYNEIDVVTIKDNIPTFTSCKNNEIDKPVFYELDAVTARFGNKYINREVTTTCPVKASNKLRAEEMEIRLNIL